VEVDVAIVSNFIVFGYVCNYGVRLGCGGRGEEHVVDVCGCNCLVLETSANMNTPVGFYTPEANGFQLRVEVQIPLTTRLPKTIKPLS
jgi:hypothetical protein